MEDEQIIALYFARDEQAISETEQKYGKLCATIAQNILGNIEDVKECVNDTYLGIWNAIPPTCPKNFMAFLCKITRNISLKRLAYNGAEKRDTARMVLFSDLSAEFDNWEDLLLDSHFSQEEDVELGKRISHFLQQEKPDSRAVFLRRYYFLDSIGAIATRYGFTESKVKNMLYHTRNRLRKYLVKEMIDL